MAVHATPISHGNGEPDRRRFVVGLMYGLWSIIGALLAGPALGYLLLPPKTRRHEEWVDAGDVSRLQPGVPAEMVFRRNRVDGWKVTSEKSSAWVVKTAADRIVAFGPQCTHLGCAYRWDADKKNFLCPCHTSLFGADGAVLEGPAPRPLDRYDVKVENNRLLIGALHQIQEKSA